MKKVDLLGKLLPFLRKLQEAKIAYELRHSRYDAIMVDINVPGERWEVEFLEDGDVDVERFHSKGGVGDESLLEELFAKHSDAETSPEDSVAKHDGNTRK